MKDNAIFSVWLASRFKQCMPFMSALVRDFGSAEKVYEAEDYSKTDYLTRRDKQLLLDKNLEKADRIIADCKMHGIDIITSEEERFPSNLREIYNAPVLLYAKGSYADFDNSVVISVVGSREPCKSSLDVTDSLVRGMSRAGFVTVSGLAYGIDAAAHKAALITEGKTVAFLAGGLDKIYPSEHTELAQFVMTNGGLFSEYPPGTPCHRENFSFRNRLISGISNGVLVVQAAKKSGTMLTVAHATEQNKDMFVVPGDVYLFDASNELIKNGAKLVTEPLDIIEEYLGVYIDRIVKEKPPEKPKIQTYTPPVQSYAAEKKQVHRAPAVGLTEQERSLLQIIKDNEGITFDNIVRKGEISPSAAASSVSRLEMKGYIVKNGRGYNIK